jgi:tetratricopeptide (TPR) repeat protein
VRKLPLGLATAVIVHVLPGCTPKRPVPESASSSPTAGTRAEAGAGAGAATGAVVPFIEDDYPRALAEARARRVPLFIDAWAPWCHTCLSLRAHVFTDPRLQPLAARYVWLSLDTERDENAPAVAHLGVHVLPTLFVIDPATEQAELAWAGSLTAIELARLLEDMGASDGERRAGGEAMAMMLRGHRASGARDVEGAIVDYRAALAAAPADWPARSEVVDALVLRLSDAKRLPECVSVAADEVPHMPPGTPLADTLRSAMSCANELPARAPERAYLAKLVDAGERVVSDTAQPILADDRSDLYDYVVDALRDLGRQEDAKRMAAAWASFLEDEAARAPTPSARAVFDAHRLLAYTAIGEPQRAVPMLEQSERDFPGDYNPPARLGMALFEMKRYDEASVAVSRALARAYGPRKLRLWSLEADVLVAKGDPAGARKALRDAVDFAASVPLTGAYPALRDALARRLASAGSH